MYSDWVSPAVAGFLAVWLLVLSFFVWREGNFLKSLFPKSGERQIRRKFEEVVGIISEFDKRLKVLKEDLEILDREGLLHIQKVALLRFNPYDETGGDQSFTIALLDQKGTGFVLTSLHARSGTRVFAKPILGGKSEKYKLSKEEESVIKKALES